MDEVERSAVAVRVKKGFHFFTRHPGVQCLQASQREDGVIKVRPAGAVKSRPVGGKLTPKKIADEFGRIAEQPGSTTGNLEKLQTKTHFAMTVSVGASNRTPSRT